MTLLSFISMFQRKYPWYSFVCVVSNVPGSDKLVIIQLVDLDNNRLISQLMRGIAIF